MKDAEFYTKKEICKLYDLEGGEFVILFGDEIIVHPDYETFYDEYVETLSEGLSDRQRAIFISQNTAYAIEESVKEDLDNYDFYVDLADYDDDDEIEYDKEDFPIIEKKNRKGYFL